MTKKIIPVEYFADGEFEEPSERDYEKAKRKYIAEYQKYEVGGLWSSGSYVKRPDIGEAEWNSEYPDGYQDWVGGAGSRLSSYGQRHLIRKVNELIDEINTLKGIPPKKKKETL